MIILQTAGGEGGSILGANMLGNQMDQVTTFRNNSYIHRLNRTLQAELRAVSAYSGATEMHESLEPFTETCTEGLVAHQLCGKQLIRIIIANHGIPEENSALSIGLTKRWVRMCMSFDLLQTTKLTLVQIERNLQTNYTKLLREAPMTDIALLEQLMRTSKKQLNNL